MNWRVGYAVGTVLLAGSIGEVHADECTDPAQPQPGSARTYAWPAYAASLGALRDAIAECPEDWLDGAPAHTACKNSAMSRLGGRVPEIKGATLDLAAKMARGGVDYDSTACTPSTTINPEIIKQIKFWCDNGKEGCLSNLDTAIEIMSAAASYEPCVDKAIDTHKEEGATKARTERCEKKAAEKAAKDAEQAKADQLRTDKQAAAKQAAEEKAAHDAQAEEERDANRKAVYAEQTRVADESNAATVANYNDTLAASSKISGGNEPHGASAHIHVELGTAALVTPVYSDTEGLDVATPYSSGTTAVGLGLHMMLGLEPWHTPWFALGVYGQGDMGVYANPGGSTHVIDTGGGLFGSVGPQAKNSLVWRAGLGYRGAGASGNSGGGIVDAYSSGSGSFIYKRLGVGWRHCYVPFDDPRFCFIALQLDLSTDLVSDIDVVPIVLGVSARISGKVTIVIRGSLGYPRAGTPSFAEQHDTSGMPYSDPAGFMGEMTIGYSYDHYGPLRGAATSSGAREPTYNAVRVGYGALTGGLGVGYERRLSHRAAMGLGVGLHALTAGISYSFRGGGRGGVYVDGQLAAAGFGVAGVNSTYDRGFAGGFSVGYDLHLKDLFALKMGVGAFTVIAPGYAEFTYDTFLPDVLLLDLSAGWLF